MKAIYAAVLAVLAAGCARDPMQVAWDDAFDAALRKEPAERVALFDTLVASAPRGVDLGAAAFEAANSLEATELARGEAPLGAARRWIELTKSAPRRVDRARAHYELARLAERRGLLDIADLIDRALIRHYPDLMPGERALAHLVRRALARGGADADRAMDKLLDDFRHDEVLLAGPLGDNVVFLAGEEAERRFRRDGELAMAALAERIYRRIAAEFPTSTLANHALWNLSFLLHARGAFDDEIAAIRAIQRSRAEVSLFGQDEHEFYWKGQLRIARILWLDLRRPADAVRAYLEYSMMFPKTSRHDDNLFFAGCAARAAGSAPAVNPYWERLRAEFPTSKYLRRLPDPSADQCRPHEIEP